MPPAHGSSPDRSSIPSSEVTAADVPSVEKAPQTGRKRALSEVSGPKPELCPREIPLLGGSSGCGEALPAELQSAAVNMLNSAVWAKSPNIRKFTPDASHLGRKIMSAPGRIEFYQVTGLSSFLYRGLSEQYAAVHQRIFAVYDREKKRVFFDQAAYDATLKDSSAKRPRTLFAEIGHYMQGDKLHRDGPMLMREGIHAAHRVQYGRVAMCHGPFTTTFETGGGTYARGNLSQGKEVRIEDRQKLKFQGFSVATERMLEPRFALIADWYRQLTGARELPSISFKPGTSALISFNLQDNAVVFCDKILDLKLDELRCLTHFVSVYLSTYERTITPRAEQRHFATLMAVCANLVKEESSREYCAVWSMALGGVERLTRATRINSPLFDALRCVNGLLDDPEYVEMFPKLRRGVTVASQLKNSSALEKAVRKILNRPEESDGDLFTAGRESGLVLAPSLHDITAHKLTHPFVPLEVIAEALWQKPQLLLETRIDSKTKDVKVASSAIGVLVRTWEQEYDSLRIPAAGYVGTKLYVMLCDAANVLLMPRRPGENALKNARHIFEGILEELVVDTWLTQQSRLAMQRDTQRAEDNEERNSVTRHSEAVADELLSSVLGKIKSNPDALFSGGAGGNRDAQRLGLVALSAVLRMEGELANKHSSSSYITEMLSDAAREQARLSEALMGKIGFSIGTSLRRDPNYTEFIRDLSAQRSLQRHLMVELKDVLSDAERLLGERKVEGQNPVAMAPLARNPRTQRLNQQLERIEGLTVLIAQGHFPVSDRLTAIAAAYVSQLDSTMTQVAPRSRSDEWALERGLFDLLCRQTRPGSELRDTTTSALQTFFTQAYQSAPSFERQLQILTYFAHYLNFAGPDFAPVLRPLWAAIVVATGENRAHLPVPMRVLEQASSEYCRDISMMVTRNGEKLLQYLKTESTPEFKRFLLGHSPRQILKGVLEDLTTEGLREALRGIPLEDAVKLTAGAISKIERREFSHRESYESFLEGFPETVTDIRRGEELKNFCAILGVPRTADSKTIVKSYRMLSMLYHTDRFELQGEEAVEYAQAKFKLINEAYEVLSDPDKKKRHLTRIPNDFTFYPKKPWFLGLPEILDAPEPMPRIEYHKPDPQKS